MPSEKKHRSAPSTRNAGKKSLMERGRRRQKKVALTLNNFSTSRSWRLRGTKITT
jgi:hypothetical protein